MNIKRSGFRWSAFMAAWLLLCVLLLPGHALAQDTSDPVSLETPCTVRIFPCGPGDEAFADDVATARIRVDLYKVAEAVPLADRDGFSLRPVAPFDGLTVNQYAKPEEWQSLARAAGAVVFARLPGLTPAATGMTGETISLPAAGLYVAIPHGEGLTDYVRTEDGLTLTFAHSANHTYLYEPELVVAPSKELEEGSFTSSKPWQYNVTVTLKPQQEGRFGALRVVKDLVSHPEGTKATFVFQVVVNNGPAKVYSLDFSNPGQKSFRIDNLPAGAQVTVTEIYSGATYKLTTPREQTATILADDVVSVAFQNEFEPTGRSGYAF